MTPSLRATLGVLTAVALTLPGCATNPVSGRPEVVFMSREKEIELGKKAAEQVAERMTLMTDGELLDYVRAVGERVAARAPRQDVEYSFDIVDMIEPNAFALPGGPVYVSRGLLALFNTEDELANVLAHEVGHVAGRHHVRGDARNKVLGVPTLLGTILAGMTLGQGGAYLAQVAGGGLVAAHSRGQESEADAVGQEVAAEAGWDPLGMSHFLNTLDRYGALEFGESPRTGFFATHPAARERVALTREYARNLTPAPAETLDRPAFLDKLRGLAVGQDPKAGIFVDDNVFLHPDLGLRIRFPREWSTLNAPSFVMAFEDDGAAQIRLELQGPAQDPREAARDFLLKERRERREAEAKGERPPEALEIERQGRRQFHRRRAFWIEGTIAQGQGTVALYWIPIEDNMYRLTCVVATQLYRRGYGRDCQATARSLRRIRKQEREAIRRVEVEIARAEPGETLEQFNARTGNTWSREETALANGLHADSTLEAGQRLKVALAREYVPAPPPQPPAPEAEPESAAESSPDREEASAGAEGEPETPPAD